MPLDRSYAELGFLILQKQALVSPQPLLTLLRLPGIHIDQPDPFSMGQEKGVAINDSLDSIEFVLGECRGR